MIGVTGGGKRFAHKLLIFPENLIKDEVWVTLDFLPYENKKYLRCKTKVQTDVIKTNQGWPVSKMTISI